MGANVTRRQHYVPQCLLRQFTNSTGKLWVYDAEARKAWTSTPGNIGHKRDLYTLQTSAGTADRRLEDLLSEQVDGPGDMAIKALLDRQTLSAIQIRSFFLFIAAQCHRTPAAFAQLSALLSAPMNESLRRAARFEPQFREHLISGLRAVGQTDDMIEQGFALIERGGCQVKPGANHLLSLAFDIILETARTLETMRWIFARVPAGDPDLVLSDHPVSLRRLRAPREPLGLAYPDVEVTLPLSSRVVAVGRREGKNAYGELNLGAAAAIHGTKAAYQAGAMAGPVQHRQRVFPLRFNTPGPAARRLKTVMDQRRLEDLIASIDLEPPAPLTDEERAAWDFFQEWAMKLRQISTAKRGARNARQRLKNRGHVSSVAPTDKERADFDARTSTVNTRLKILRQKHDERDLENRREYEIHNTRWTLVERHLLTDAVFVIHCYSPQQLESTLETYLHPTSEILEIFIDRQRLNDQERADFLAEAERARKDHRVDRY